MRAIFACAVLAAGCAHSEHVPQVVARHELILRYPGHLVIDAGHEPLTEAPRFSGLASFVHCVGPAHWHALQAEWHGQRALALSGIAIGLAAAGVLGYALVGVGAAAGSDNWVAVPLLAGLIASSGGIMTAWFARWDVLRAHGNAVDAVNYYNDEIGSWGGRCGPAPAVQTSRPPA